MSINIFGPYFICQLCEDKISATILPVLQLCNACKIQATGNCFCNFLLLKENIEQNEQSPQQIIIYNNDGGD
jgi:hypothetical protein